MYTLEEFDKYKTKVLKYVLYKKRTKQEVKNKFYNTIESEMLEEIIENLEENGYIDDNNYIVRAVNEFKALNNLSIKEIKYKLYSKGVPSNLVEDYISNNAEELLSYELDSAKNIAIKKELLMEEQEISKLLLKKGYLSESVKYALSQLNKKE